MRQGGREVSGGDLVLIAISATAGLVVGAVGGFAFRDHLFRLISGEWDRIVAASERR